MPDGKDSNREDVKKRAARYRAELRRAYLAGELSPDEVERFKALAGDFENVLVPGVNDLATTHPELAAEWHPVKNGDLKPTDVTAGSAKQVWWLGSKCGHAWEATVDSRTRGCGCPYCANKKVLPGFNDLATSHPALAAEWHPALNGDLKPTDVTAGSGKKAWWLGSCGHVWKSWVKQQVKSGAKCPYCAKRKLLVGFNDLATTHPELAAEWHPTKNGSLEPGEIACWSKKRAWWLGSRCRHVWEATVDSRTRGCGCPYCANKKVLPGFNDLATSHPALAAEWHPALNGDLKPTDVTAGSGKKAWWLGSCGHVWETSVQSRTKSGSGCPVCSGRAVLKGINDLATTHPDLAAEWHPTKNGDLKPTEIKAGSGRKVWWRCKRCGHAWETAACYRKRGSGCPACKLNKRVLCVENGKEFGSIVEAGRAMSCSKDPSSMIIKALKDPTKTAYGCHWRYAEEGEAAAGR